MEKKAATETRLDVLCRKAMAVAAAGEYLPGRLHFATELAARLESEVAALAAMKPAVRPATGNGLCTALERCWRMYFLAGDLAAVERVKVVCAERMGLTWIPGKGLTNHGAV